MYSIKYQLIPFPIGVFETVDTSFWFDLEPCGDKEVPTCDQIEKARNMVVVIGEKSDVTNSSKTYGYVGYELKDDDTLEALPENFDHSWGLKSDATFTGKFWPPFKRNGTLIIGSALNRNQKILYLLVTEIDDNKNPMNKIYTRDLNYRKGWGQWTALAANSLEGMFTINGNVYVVDTNSTIMSYQMQRDGLIHKKTIVNQILFNI